MSLPLSIIIITHRRDQLFESSLKSSQFAEQVLIFDNHSQNDWLKLKKKYHFDLIMDDQPIKNFGALRNKLINKAKFEDVLFLDSDEVLSANAETEIKKCLAKTEYNGFYLRRIDYFLGQPMKHGEVGNVWKLRLGKKGMLKFSGAIHEIGRSAGNLGRCPTIINHYPHASISSFLDKIIFYTQLQAEEREKDYSRNQIAWELLLYPPAKFLVNFIFKLGFLDGKRGLIYALMMSFHSAAFRILIYEQLT